MPPFDSRRPPENDGRSYLSEAELACRWRHTRRTLQRWRRAGRMPRHVVIGRRVLYPFDEVLRHERALAQAAEGEEL